MTSYEKLNSKITVIYRTQIFVSNIKMFERIDKLNFSWVNSLISEQKYPIKESYLGLWHVEVLRPKNKMSFKQIVSLCKKDGYIPASIHHALVLLSIIDRRCQFNSLLAPASMHLDDFEHFGCTVITTNNNERKLGLGNWRGTKISGYDILRVKKINGKQFYSNLTQ